MADETSTPEQIEEATKQGWVDDESHPKYKTAADFLAVGEKIAPVQTAKIKGLEEKLERANRLAEESNQRVEEMQSHLFDDLNAREKAGYDRAMADIEKKKLAAVEEGDTDEYRRLKQEGDNLKAPEKKAPTKIEPKTKDEIDPIYEEWTKKNDVAHWIDKDMAMTGAAVEIGKEIMRTGPMYGLPFYEEVERRVKEAFPHKFEKGDDVVDHAGVETMGHKPPKRNNGKKDWKSLPKKLKDDGIDNGYIDRYFKGDKEKYATKCYEQGIVE